MLAVVIMASFLFWREKGGGEKWAGSEIVITNIDPALSVTRYYTKYFIVDVFFNALLKLPDRYYCHSHLTDETAEIQEG